MSRDAPTRSAMSCCVSFSGTTSCRPRSPRQRIEQPHQPAVDVGEREALHVLGRRAARDGSASRSGAARNPGCARMNSRNCARLTIAQVVGSIVITDAERGEPSSDISPTYSPGPWKSMTTSRAGRVARVHLHPAGQDDVQRIARSPSLISTVLLRETARTTPEAAIARSVLVAAAARPARSRYRQAAVPQTGAADASTARAARLSRTCGCRRSPCRRSAARRARGTRPRRAAW